MSEPKKFKKGWNEDPAPITSHVWYEYYPEDTDDENDGLYSVCPSLKGFLNFTEVNRNKRITDLGGYFEDFPNVTEDELTLFELETGCDLTEFIEILKEEE